MNPPEAWTWIDWLWVVAGSLVGLTGFALAWWSLRRGRAKKGPKCPTCRYDMRGLPGLRCPECGRTATNASDLMRRPRQWRVALAGIGIVLAGAGAGVHPKVRREGWVSILPTTVLMVALPDDLGSSHYDSVKKEWVQDPFVAEFARRLAAGNLGDWQVRYAFEHDRPVRHRAKWPGDRPLVVAVQRPAWGGLGETKLTARLADTMQVKAGAMYWESCGNASMGRYASEQEQTAGMVAVGGKSVTFDYQFAYEVGSGGGGRRGFGGSFRTVSGTLTVPIETVATAAEACVPDDDAGLTARVRAGLSAVSEEREIDGVKRQMTWVRLATAGLKEDLRDTALIATAVVLRDGKPMGANGVLVCRDERYDFGQGFSSDLLQYLNIKWSVLDAAEMRRYSVRITGEVSGVGQFGRGNVLTDYAKGKYWTGTFEIPMAELLSAPAPVTP